jgi:hypothetical protein
MAIQVLDFRDRFAEGPRTAPAVRVTALRHAGRAGTDLRLADDPERGLVRIVGGRAQLGPCKGLVAGGLPTATLEVDTLELPALARVGRAWRQRRIDWAAHVHGSHGVAGMYRFPAQRYRAGTWERETLGHHGGGWPAEEITYVGRAVDGESYGSDLVDVVLENRLGQRVGAVVRAGADRCVSMTRGSLVIGRHWVAAIADYAKVADFLVLATSDTARTGIGHLVHDAVEFDAATVWLLEEAAQQRP